MATTISKAFRDLHAMWTLEQLEAGARVTRANIAENLTAPEEKRHWDGWQEMALAGLAELEAYIAERKLDEAREIARVALTPGTVPSIQDLVRAFNILSDAEAIADQRLAARLEREFPQAIENYDERGNWVGAVSYENGWTA